MGKTRWEYNSEEAEQIEERTRPEMNPKKPTRSEYIIRKEREPEERTDRNPKEPTRSEEYVGKSRLQSLRERTGELRKRAKEKQEEREEKKEIKKLESEIEHPAYTKVKERIKKGSVRTYEKGKETYGRAERAVGEIGKEIKAERKRKGQFPYGAPKVYTRPTRAHYGRPPSPIRQRQTVDYGGSEPSGFSRMLGEEGRGVDRPQIDLLGSTEKKEINLLRTNGNGHRKEFSLMGSNGNGKRKEFSLIGGNGNSIRKNINLLGNGKKKIRLL